MNIVGIIPARGGSKGIKGKNIIDLEGKPLIGYTLEAALSSKLLDKVAVSTDSDKIASVVKSNWRSDKLKVIKRPVELAKDDSSLEEALLHAVEQLKGSGYQASIVVLMQANVPIRKEGVIDKVIKTLVESDADSCVTCYEADQTPELMKIMDDDGRLIPVCKDAKGLPRQMYLKRYLLDGAVVALRVENIFKAQGVKQVHKVLGEKVIPVIQENKMHSLEIDDFNDLELAKYYIRKINSK